MNNIGRTFAALSFIAFAILLPPFCWHCKSRNTPAAALIFWLLYSNLNSFIGAIIWSSDDFYLKYDGKGFCDVLSKLNSGSNSGKICAAACIAIHLFLVLKGASHQLINNKSTKKIIMDLSICFATPIFVMSTIFIVETRRIAIVRYTGCSRLYAPDWVSVVIYHIWNLIWSTVAVTFAILTVILYFRKKYDVKDLLKCTNSGLNIKRFARLLIFSLLIIFTLLPISAYLIALDAPNFGGAYEWSLVHGPDWNETAFFDLGATGLYEKYIDIGVSVIAFLLFGLGTDAVSMYKIWLINIKLGKVFNINDPRSVVPVTAPIEAKTPSGKSEFSMGSAYTGATIADGIDVEFNKIMEEDMASKFNESASEHDISDYLTYEGRADESKEEMEYIMNLVSDNHSDDINFNYSVSHKV